MSAMASQITSLTTVYSAVYSGADQRKHQSSAPLAFVRRIHRSPVNSPHKGPVTRKMFPFGDVIMQCALIGRADSRVAPNQREASLQSNAVSHWLDANLESALPAGTGRVIGWSKYRLGNSSPALNSGKNAHVIHGNSRNFSEGSPLCSPNDRQGVCPWGCARRLLKSLVPYFSLRAVSGFIHILLTHWGRAIYICVRKLAIIGSENAPSHYLNQCWSIVNWNLRNEFQWKLDRTSYIFVKENAFENVVCEMATILSRPQCVTLNNTLLVPNTFICALYMIKIGMLIMVLIEHCITLTYNNKPRIN